MSTLALIQALLLNLDGLAEHNFVSARFMKLRKCHKLYIKLFPSPTFTIQCRFLTSYSTLLVVQPMLISPQQQQQSRALDLANFFPTPPWNDFVSFKSISHTMFKGPTMLLHQSGHYMYLALRKTNSATAAETANCKIQVTIYHHAMMMVRVVVE